MSPPIKRGPALASRPFAQAPKIATTTIATKVTAEVEAFRRYWSVTVVLRAIAAGRVAPDPALMAALFRLSALGTVWAARAVELEEAA
jgi:hypothetical protein